MAQRRFGPTRGAGVVIIEKQAQQSITPGALGTTAYVGVMQKGPVNKPFPVSNTTQYGFRAGSYMPESLLPDAAIDRLKLGNGSGQLWLNRLTDGNEKTAYVELTNRKSPRSLAMKVEAGNPGRWGGKKQIVVDEYSIVTATTVQLTNPPAGLKVDELVGGSVRFNAIAGQSYPIIANTASGLITFPSDVDVVTDLAGSADQLIAVELENDGLAVAVKISEGTEKPTTEFKMEVYFIEDGVTTRQRTFDNLSPDPSAGNYFEKVVNDDSDADYLVKVSDLQVGVMVQASIRPANLAGKSLTLTDTVLTLKITDEFANSPTGATATLSGQSPGASIIKDLVTLTVTAVGARSTRTLTFGANPDPADSIAINDNTLTFVAAVTNPQAEVLIGATAEATLDNLVAAINAKRDISGDPLYQLVFAEKSSASTMELYAATAGLAGDAITTTSTGGANVPTFGAGTLSGGADQTWSYVSASMPFIVGEIVTSGVAKAAVNPYSLGFTVVDTTYDSTKEWQVGETLLIEIKPLEVDALVGGQVAPKSSLYREKFDIVSNTSEAITVKSGSLMTTNAAAGDDFVAQYVQQLAGGSDGLAEIADQDYLDAYDTGASPLKALRGKNLGLVKIATPGVTSTVVQKAGVAFAGSQNWQYRYEIPANISSEDAAEEYINDTIGRNDFAVVTFPTYAYVTNPVGEGLKLTSQVGAIHGVEARIARDYDGYHKAAAGVDAILSNIVKLPEALVDKELDQEVLNPQGIGIIKVSNGNFVLWGDRVVGVDPGFKFKHKREYISHVENVFIENYDFIIYALNRAEERTQLYATFVQYFLPEFAKGAVVGNRFADAVQIKIDEENNPASETQQGNMHAEVGLNVVDTVERFIITVSKLGVTEAVA